MKNPIKEAVLTGCYFTDINMINKYIDYLEQLSKTMNIEQISTENLRYELLKREVNENQGMHIQHYKNPPVLFEVSKSTFAKGINLVIGVDPYEIVGDDLLKLKILIELVLGKKK